MSKERARMFERAEPARTAEEARQRRAGTMTTIGIVALLFGIVSVGSGGGAAAFLIALLGIALLVGGLVIRR